MNTGSRNCTENKSLRECSLKIRIKKCIKSEALLLLCCSVNLKFQCNSDLLVASASGIQRGRKNQRRSVRSAHVSTNFQDLSPTNRMYSGQCGVFLRGKQFAGSNGSRVRQILITRIGMSACDSHREPELRLLAWMPCLSRTQPLPLLTFVCFDHSYLLGIQS